MERTCSIISEVLRFLTNPPFPVRQKEQFNLQPTCVDIQRVRFSSSGMRTFSMVLPSSSTKRYFRVPSFETLLSVIGRRFVQASSLREFLNFRGRFVISLISPASF